MISKSPLSEAPKSKAHEGWVALGDLLSGNAGREARARGGRAALPESNALPKAPNGQDSMALQNKSPNSLSTKAQKGWQSLGYLLSGAAGRDARALAATDIRREAPQDGYLSARTRNALENARRVNVATGGAEDKSLGDSFAQAYQFDPERATPLAEFYRGNGGTLDNRIANMETPLGDALIDENTAQAAAGHALTELERQQHAAAAAKARLAVIDEIDANLARQELRPAFDATPLRKPPTLNVGGSSPDAALPTETSAQLPQLQADPKWRENLETQARAAIAAGADPAAVTARMKLITDEMGRRLNQASRSAGQQPMRIP